MTERIKEAGWNVVEMWECQWDKICKIKNLPTTRADIEHLKCLIPRDAYFGGRVNAAKLYYKCTEEEKIHYIDITSMYPHVMSAPQYQYPIHTPTIYKKGRDEIPPLGSIFGLIRCKIQPPSDLYFPLLPERSESGKVVFHLNQMSGTWTSVEIQKAVSLGYMILDIYEVHHFQNTSNQLFSKYNETFFAIKRQAKLDGNKGLEAIAKMCINGPTGKWGYNPAKQKSTRIVTETDEFFKYICGSYSQVSMTLMNEDVCMATVSDGNDMTEHPKSNVYISAFITAYSRLKLYNEALEPLGRNVLYFDTDSVIYVSPTGDHLVPVDTTGEMGLWTSEAKPNDHFVEFCSAGPKTYALKSFSGTGDIAKSKGFSLHYNNQKVFNFETLKEQAIYKGLGMDIEKLSLHRNDVIMRRNRFQIIVERNKGKILNMVYDKRKILNPDCDYHLVTCIDTLPWGHRDILV